MKKIMILALSSLITIVGYSQPPLTSLDQNFNSTCFTYGPSYPVMWYTEWNLSILGGWNCSPTDGRNGTGGMECTGYYNSANHMDTAYLISPQLDISGYTGNVYIQYDTKTTDTTTSFLAFMPFRDSTYNPSDTSALPATPALGLPDVSGWVTHQTDITAFKGAPFYFAFRYTSNPFYAPIWYLDNVLLTGTPLSSSEINRSVIPLTVVGNSGPDQIRISYSIVESGTYCLSVYDMMGRTVSYENIFANAGRSGYTISGLQLHSGMYFVKMSNGNVYGTAKTMIW